MNILLITGYVHNFVGGVEMHNKMLFEAMPEIHFIEIPIKEFDENKIDNFKNVTTLDTISKIFARIQKNYINFFGKKIILKSILYYFSLYIRTKIYKFKLFRELDMLVEKYDIKKIIWTVPNIVNLKFIKKYRNIIYWIQHNSPIIYLNSWYFSEKKCTYKKRNFLNIFLMKIFFWNDKSFKFFKKLVCFDDINISFFKSKINVKDRLFYKLIAPSKYRYDSSVDSKVRKKFDFISPIRLSNQKNPQFIAKFARDNSQYNLYVCGSGKKSDMLSGISNIKLSKAIDGDILREAYLQSKFLLLASFFEGSPFVVKEAISLGIPCIVANTFPSAKFLVGEHSERGFLFDLKDENNFQNINKFIESCNYEELVENCLKFSKENLSFDSFELNARKIFFD